MHGIVLDIECSKIIFLKMELKKKRNELLPVEDNCITIVKFTYLLFSSFFFLFFYRLEMQISRFENSSFFRGSEKYGIIEFLELIICLQNTRELLIVSLIINILDSFFFSDVTLGFLIFISFNLIEFKFLFFRT